MYEVYSWVLRPMWVRSSGSLITMRRVSYHTVRSNQDETRECRGLTPTTVVAELWRTTLRWECDLGRDEHPSLKPSKETDSIQNGVGIDISRYF